MAERTALAIGASRGIGLGLVKELVGRGWDIIATLRSPGSGAGLKAFTDSYFSPLARISLTPCGRGGWIVRRGAAEEP